MKKVKVLFLCTGNSCRSQMAEGFARAYRNDDLESYSAGIEAHGLNSHAVHVMAEAGVDISDQRSQHIDELQSVAFDLVVTVCGHADENCPIFVNKVKKIHVGFDDPPKLASQSAASGGSKESQLDCYRKVRDEIKTFIFGYDFKAQLGEKTTNDK